MRSHPGGGRAIGLAPLVLLLLSGLWSDLPGPTPCAAIDDTLIVVEGGPSIQLDTGPASGEPIPPGAEKILVEVDPFGIGQVALMALGYNTPSSTVELTITEAFTEDDLILLQAVDDGLVEGSHTALVYRTWLGADGAPVHPTEELLVVVEDNDEGLAQILTSNSTTTRSGHVYTRVELDEGSETTIGVFLGAPSDQTVLVRVQSPDPSRLVAHPSTLVFGVANFSQPQMVTISAPRDLTAYIPLVDDLVVSLVAESANLAYNLTSWPVEVEFHEADPPGLTVSPEDVRLVEGDTSVTELSIRLFTEPRSPVTLLFDDIWETAVFSPPKVTFLPGRPPVTQKVVLTAVDNAIEDGSRQQWVQYTTLSEDPAYDGLTGRLNVTVEDSDAAGMIYAPKVLDVKEGQPGIFSVSLATRPSSYVQLSISCDREDAVLSQDSIRFDLPDWTSSERSMWKTLTVSISRDFVVTGDSEFSCGFMVEETASLPYFLLKGVELERIVVRVKDVDVARYCFDSCAEDDFGSTYSMEESISIIGGAPVQLPCALTTRPTHAVQLLVYELDREKLSGLDRSLYIEPEEWEKGKNFSFAIDSGDPNLVFNTEFCIMSVSEDPAYHLLPNRCVVLSLVGRTLETTNWTVPAAGGVVPLSLGLHLEVPPRESYPNVDEAMRRWLYATQLVEVQVACKPDMRKYNLFGWVWLQPQLDLEINENNTGRLRWQLPETITTDMQGTYHFLIAGSRCRAEPWPLDYLGRPYPMDYEEVCRQCQDKDYDLHPATIVHGVLDDRPATTRYAEIELDFVPVTHVALVQVIPSIVLSLSNGQPAELGFTEKGDPTPVLSGLTLNPLGDGLIPRPVRRIDVSFGQGTYDQQSDSLEMLPNDEPFDASWDPEAGVLSFVHWSGYGKLFEIERVLQYIVYKSDTPRPDGSFPRFFYFTMIDDVSFYRSKTPFASVLITPVPDPPALSLSAGNYKCETTAGPQTLDLYLNLTDPDSVNLRGARIVVEQSNTVLEGISVEVIAANNTPGVTMIRTAPGTWVAYGAAPGSAYQAWLRAVRVSSSSQPGQIGVRISAEAVDGMVGTAEKVIDVEPPSEPPVIVLPDKIAVAGGATATGFLQAYDALGNPSVFEPACPPQKGSLDVSVDGAFSFTADIAARGFDSFTATATSLALQSSKLAVVFGITDPIPVATDQTIRMVMGANTTFVLAPGGLSAVNWALITREPSIGHLDIEEETETQPGSSRRQGRGRMVYTSPVLPDVGSYEDSIEFTVWDESILMYSFRRTVTFLVSTPEALAGMPPVLADVEVEAISGLPEEGLFVVISGQSPYSLWFNITRGPENGTVTIRPDGVSFVYQPPPFPWTGSVNFTYEAISDLGLESVNSATVFIEILPDESVPLVGCHGDSPLFQTELPLMFPDMPIGAGSDWWRPWVDEELSQVPTFGSATALAAADRHREALLSLQTALEALASAPVGGQMACSRYSYYETPMTFSASAEPALLALLAVGQQAGGKSALFPSKQISEYRITEAPQHGQVHLMDSLEDVPAVLEAAARAWAGNASSLGLNGTDRHSVVPSGPGVPVLALYLPDPFARGRPLDTFRWEATDSVGMVSSEARVDITVKCAEGYRVAPNDGGESCVICGPGSYTAPGQLDSPECYRCAPGSHQPALGATGCVFCPENQYQDEWGQPGCIGCPDANQLSGLGSPLVTDCLCQVGMFAPAPGTEPCQECQPGLELCEELGQLVPKPAGPGLWVDPTGTGDTLQCLPAGACLPHNTVAEVLAAQCAAGYTGYGCQACDGDFYRRADSSCGPCGLSAWVELGVAGAVAVFVMGLLLWPETSAVFAAVKILIVFLSRAGLVLLLPVDWPEDARWLRVGLLPFALMPDALSGPCLLGPELGFSARLVLTNAFPAVALAWVGLRAAGRRWRSVRSRRRLAVSPVHTLPPGKGNSGDSIALQVKLVAAYGSATGSSSGAVAWPEDESRALLGGSPGADKKGWNPWSNKPNHQAATGPVAEAFGGSGSPGGSELHLLPGTGAAKGGWRFWRRGTAADRSAASSEGADTDGPAPVDLPQPTMIAEWLTLFFWGYAAVADVNLSYFACTSVNGRLLLTANPEVVCGEGMHGLLFPVAVAGLAVYVAAVPVLTALLFFRDRTAIGASREIDAVCRYLSDDPGSWLDDSCRERSKLVGQLNSSDLIRHRTSQLARSRSHLFFLMARCTPEAFWWDLMAQASLLLAAVASRLPGRPVPERAIASGVAGIIHFLALYVVKPRDRPWLQAMELTATTGAIALSAAAYLLSIGLYDVTGEGAMADDILIIAVVGSVLASAVLLTAYDLSPRLRRLRRRGWVRLKVTLWGCGAVVRAVVLPAVLWYKRRWIQYKLALLARAREARRRLAEPRQLAARAELRAAWDRQLEAERQAALEAERRRLANKPKELGWFGPQTSDSERDDSLGPNGRPMGARKTGARRAKSRGALKERRTSAEIAAGREHRPKGARSQKSRHRLEAEPEAEAEPEQVGAKERPRAGRSKNRARPVAARGAKKGRGRQPLTEAQQDRLKHLQSIGAITINRPAEGGTPTSGPVAEAQELPGPEVFVSTAGLATPQPAGAVLMPGPVCEAEETDVQAAYPVDPDSSQVAAALPAEPNTLLASAGPDDVVPFQASTSSVRAEAVAVTSDGDAVDEGSDGGQVPDAPAGAWQSDGEDGASTHDAGADGDADGARELAQVSDVAKAAARLGCWQMFRQRMSTAASLFSVAAFRDFIDSDIWELPGFSQRGRLLSNLSATVALSLQQGSVRHWVYDPARTQEELDSAESSSLRLLMMLFVAPEPRRRPSLPPWLRPSLPKLSLGGKLSVVLSRVPTAKLKALTRRKATSDAALLEEEEDQEALVSDAGTPERKEVGSVASEEPSDAEDAARGKPGEEVRQDEPDTEARLGAAAATVDATEDNERSDDTCLWTGTDSVLGSSYEASVRTNLESSVHGAKEIAKEMAVVSVPEPSEVAGTVEPAEDATEQPAGDGDDDFEPDAGRDSGGEEGDDEEEEEDEFEEDDGPEEPVSVLHEFVIEDNTGTWSVKSGSQDSSRVASRAGSSRVRSRASSSRIGSRKSSARVGSRMSSARLSTAGGSHDRVGSARGPMIHPSVPEEDETDLLEDQSRHAMEGVTAGPVSEGVDNGRSRRQQLSLLGLEAAQSLSCLGPSAGPSWLPWPLCQPQPTVRVRVLPAAGCTAPGPVAEAEEAQPAEAVGDVSAVALDDPSRRGSDADASEVDNGEREKAEDARDGVSSDSVDPAAPGTAAGATASDTVGDVPSADPEDTAKKAEPGAPGLPDSTAEVLARAAEALKEAALVAGDDPPVGPSSVRLADHKQACIARMRKMLRPSYRTASLEWLAFAAEPWHAVLLGSMAEPERRPWLSYVTPAVAFLRRKAANLNKKRKRPEIAAPEDGQPAAHQPGDPVAGAVEGNTGEPQAAGGGKSEPSGSLTDEARAEGGSAIDMTPPVRPDDTGANDQMVKV